MIKIVLASKNNHKVKEFEKILGNTCIITLGDIITVIFIICSQPSSLVTVNSYIVVMDGEANGSIQSIQLRVEFGDHSKERLFSKISPSRVTELPSVISCVNV